MGARRPLLAVAAAGVLLIAGLLPLPSADQGASLAQMGRVSGWWVHNVGAFPPAFSILSSGLIGLVIVRFGLNLIVNPREPSPADKIWKPTILSLFLAASFVLGVAMGLALHHRFPDLHRGDPVLGALSDGATSAIAAALLWTLAELVRKSGIANGALFLFGIWEVLRIGRFLSELLAAASVREPDLFTMAGHAGLLPVACTLLLLWRWRPTPMPQPIWRGLTLRSPLDLAILPLAIGGVASLIADDLAGYPAWTPQPPMYEPGLLPRTLVALLTVPAIALWLRRQPSRRGSVFYLFGAVTLFSFTLALEVVVAALVEGGLYLW
ncbi:MAG: hypothetical protein EA397_05630 [Deltaproteobacteria bacterium]|nr:MAG: hypothetical protein EA397_05630 [Deltaproteobacteria bacterium]